MNTEIMSEWLNNADQFPLECDGMTRCLSILLQKKSIEHSVCIGSVESNDGDIPLHYWIELEDGMKIDYRARMWLGNKESIPHGVFEDHVDLKYVTQNKIPGNEFVSGNESQKNFLFLILSNSTIESFPEPKTKHSLKP